MISSQYWGHVLLIMSELPHRASANKAAVTCSYAFPWESTVVIMVWPSGTLADVLVILVWSDRPVCVPAMHLPITCPTCGWFLRKPLKKPRPRFCFKKCIKKIKPMFCSITFIFIFIIGKHFPFKFSWPKCIWVTFYIFFFIRFLLL